MTLRCLLNRGDSVNIMKKKIFNYGLKHEPTRQIQIVGEVVNATDVILYTMS
jgi:hypothetical protein